MSKKMSMSEADREIVNRAISLTTQARLEALFGKRESYEIEEDLSIAAISNKAVYKLNQQELYYLKVRSELAYDVLKNYYTRRASHKLGFDINQNFGLVKEDGFNIQSLSDYEDGEVDQTEHIPLSQQIVDKIISSPKFKVEIEQSPKSRLDTLGSVAEYYLCDVDGQVVPIVLVQKQRPIKNTFPVRYSQSLSVFALLKGTVPFFISRLDFDPFNKHTNRLEEGKITTKKIKSRGTHQHIYSERFAVLVPTLKRIMHCDAQTYDFIPSFEEAKDFIEKQINVKEGSNKQLEEVFKNDVKKAHKKKKYKSNNKSFDSSFNHITFNP